jgi:VanZ family protein
MLTLLRTAFWSASIFAFVMAVVPDTPDLPGVQGDKFNHMLAFFTITILGYYSYPKLSRSRFMLAIFAFGAVIEPVQLVPVLHRDSELSDWGADVIAAVFAFACARAFDAIRGARAD